MKRLDSLTDEQKALFPVCVQEWTEHGLSTEPMDLPRFTAAVRECYKFANLANEPVVLPVSSPLAAIYMSAIILRSRELLGKQRGAVGNAVGGAVDGAVSDAVSDAVRGAVYGAVRNAVRGAVRNAVGDAVYGAVDRAVYDAVGGAVRGAVYDAVGDAVRDAVRNAVYGCSGRLPKDTLKYAEKYKWSSFWGRFNAGWQSYVGFYRRVGLDLTPDIWARADAYRDAQMNSGWWYPFTSFIVVSDTPQQISRDDAGRLHHESGMAVRYRDGWGLHVWHGVRVPALVIEHPEQITVAMIEAEANAEVRRVMVERYGLARYILDSGAQKMQEDDFGVLYRKEQKSDEPILMVKVVNSTPELDGSYKDYFLRVPPDTKTARGAVAWTFGMEEKDYAPVAQT